MKIWLLQRRREVLSILILCFAGGLALGALWPCFTPASVLAKAPVSQDFAVPVEESLLIIRRQRQPEAKPETPPPPAVVVYCTHTSEEYAGQERFNGQAGGVLQAAQSLTDAFARYGVGVILDSSIHDKSYDDAYTSSLASATALAAAYPDIQVYIDVHRDSSIEGVSTTLNTDRGSYAKMMFVVGTDEKMEHPHWRDNFTFAMAVEEQLNILLPGITRTARVYSGRYNQHIAPNAILVEIGSTDNTQQEAMASAALLAEAICLVKGWL